MGGMVRLVAALGVTAAVGLAPVGPSGVSAQEGVVVATGLASPRHLTFSPTGALYVVEAGTGGPRGDGRNCADHPLGEFCLGATGAVTQVRDNGSDPEVLSGLPSIATEAEALGPSDISITGSKKFVLSIGIGGSLEFREEFGPAGEELGTLVSGKLGDGTWEQFADVLANEATNNPEPFDIDSNPVGILRQGSSYVIADAGGNAIVRTDHKGQFTTLAVLPFVPSSFGFAADPVPTSVVQGPDGAYYISQLVGFPFDAEDSSIWRMVPGQAPTPYASGLTNVTDLAFAPDGTLYAVEIAAEGLLNVPPGELPVGAVVEVTPGATEHTVVHGDLTAPYGLAFGNGAMYVTTGAVGPVGEVVRFPLP
jgi:hypothetical protein